jgi:hypothetical protein
VVKYVDFNDLQPISGRNIMRLFVLVLVAVFSFMTINGCARKSKKAPAPAPAPVPVAVVAAPVPVAAVAAVPEKAETGSLIRKFKLVDDLGRESGAVVFKPWGGAELHDIDGTVIGVFTPPGAAAEPEVMKQEEMTAEETVPAADETMPEVDETEPVSGDTAPEVDETVPAAE